MKNLDSTSREDRYVVKDVVMRVSVSVLSVISMVLSLAFTLTTFSSILYDTSY